jgi:hypothetical protein
MAARMIERGIRFWVMVGASCGKVGGAVGK